MRCLSCRAAGLPTAKGRWGRWVPFGTCRVPTGPLSLRRGSPGHLPEVTFKKQVKPRSCRCCSSLTIREGPPKNPRFRRGWAAPIARGKNVSTVEEYVYAYILILTEDLGLPEIFSRREEIIQELHERISIIVDEIDYDFHCDILALAIKLFDGLDKNGSFETEHDEIVGTYYKYITSKFPGFRSGFFAGNRIVKTHRRVGDRYFREIFERFAEIEQEEISALDPTVAPVDGASTGDVVQAELIPASDRLVPLNHNAPEYQEVRQGIEDAIEKVSNLKTNRLSVDEKATAIAALRSASNLWEAFELKSIHIKVGIIMALEDVEKLIGEAFKMVSGALLVDFIKSLLKIWTGCDF